MNQSIPVCLSKEILIYAFSINSVAMESKYRLCRKIVIEIDSIKDVVKGGAEKIVRKPTEKRKGFFACFFVL